tara:strand:- start:1466 stop:1699 length:234 start_codon:yes stop_codon:yes gene_type:complete
MEGSVTIPIKAFDELRLAKETADEKEQNLHRAARELEVFLSFLVTRDNIQEFLDEFNRQSSTSRINIDDGRAKIVFR